MGEELGGLSIRPAQLADYAGLCELFEQGDALHRRALPQVFRQAQGPARDPEFVSEILARDDAELLMAEVSGAVVGLVQVVERAAPALPILVPRRYAVVETLVVAPKLRRRGIGRRLMGAAHAWAGTRGLATVELNVWAFNQGAVAFYEALGYQVARQVMVRRLES